MKKATPKTKQADDVGTILDVEIYVGTYIIQHVALTYPRPIATWDADTVRAAGAMAGALLSRPDALRLTSAGWQDHTLEFGVGADDGHYPFMRVSVRPCPFAIALTCLHAMPPSFITAMFPKGGVALRPAIAKAPDGPNPGPGTLRNPYSRETDCDDFDEQLQVRDAAHLAAVEAARRAAALPPLTVRPRTISRRTARRRKAGAR
jgi:hypothetical protein